MFFLLKNSKNYISLLKNKEKAIFLENETNNLITINKVNSKITLEVICQEKKGSILYIRDIKKENNKIIFDVELSLGYNRKKIFKLLNEIIKSEYSFDIKFYLTNKIGTLTKSLMAKTLFKKRKDAEEKRKEEKMLNKINAPKYKEFEKEVSEIISRFLNIKRMNKRTLSGHYTAEKFSLSELKHKIDLVVKQELFQNYDKLTTLLNEDFLASMLSNKLSQLSINKEFHLDVKKIKDREEFIFIDLNNLKAVNDNYGHIAGDLFLKTFALISKEKFPNLNHFRVGGDEFISIAKNKDDMIKYTKFISSNKMDNLLKNELFKNGYKVDEEMKLLASSGSYTVNYNEDRKSSKMIGHLKSKSDELMYVHKKLLHLKFGEYRSDLNTNLSYIIDFDILENSENYKKLQIDAKVFLLDGLKLLLRKHEESKNNKEREKVNNKIVKIIKKYGIDCILKEEELGFDL